MSRHPTGERREADFYPTPDELASFVVSILDIRGRVLEPSGGDGAFVRPLAKAGHLADVVELHPDRHPLLLEALGGDRSRLFKGRFERFYPAEPYDWVIGNPPFAQALLHVQHAHFVLRDGGHVAFLLPNTFGHTFGRYSWVRTHRPWREYALAERPSFTGDDGTNMVEYSVFVWRRGYTGRTIREYVSWDTSAADTAESVARVRTADWAMAA